MLRNYLTVAFRNLIRNRLHSVINILGLAVGIACCLVILLHVQDELSYDRHHVYADRIYRVVPNFHAGTSPPLAATLLSEFSEIVQAVRVRRIGRVPVGHADRQFYEERFYLADPDIFKIFALPFVKGDSQNALLDPFSVVITQRMAEKYFRGSDPIGQIIRVDNRHDYRVTGVLEDAPHNTHFRFDFLGSLVNRLSSSSQKDWHTVNVYTYVLLQAGYPYAELEKKLPGFFERHRGVYWNESLQPVTSIHLHSNLAGEMEPNSHIAYIYIFSATAALVLLIACINFMNLTTARSAKRAREVGMRKVVGAWRTQLVCQFLGESVFLTTVATVLAIALVELSLPAFNALAGKTMAVGYSGRFILGLLGFVFLIGLLAGSYPAFFLSAFQPTSVLKGALGPGVRSGRFRRVLVTAQFAISITLIISTGIVYAQLEYVRHKRLGFDREQIVVIELVGSGLQRRGISFKNAMLGIPGILGVAGSGSVPGANVGLQRFRAENIPEAAYEGIGFIPMRTIEVGYDFLKTYGIELVDGRDFSMAFSADVKAAFLINEAALKSARLEAYADSPIGKVLEMGNMRGREWVAGTTGPIVGLVRDFHFRSLHFPLEPVVFRLRPNRFRYLSVKVSPGRIPEAVDLLRQKWQTLAANQPFEYFFLDDALNRLYKSEEKLGKVFSVYAALTILVACLGLFGLASFAAEQRTKEIGIRKALGASVPNIVMLLLKEFVVLVILGNVIAWPTVYFLMRFWLQTFAYQIDLDLGIFAISGFLILLIAIITVSSQAIKAARANPVDALQYE